MTMIAGFALPDSVLIAADCRVTWDRAAAPLSFDSALKLLKLTDAILMGYAGDVQTVQYLFGDVTNAPKWLPTAVTTLKAGVAAASLRVNAFLFLSTSPE